MTGKQALSIFVLGCGATTAALAADQVSPVGQVTFSRDVAPIL